MERQCSHCKQNFPLTSAHFYKASNRSGFSYLCRNCAAKYRKNYHKNYHNRPDIKQKISTWGRSWRQKQIEKHGAEVWEKMEYERQKAYYAKHPEKLKNLRKKTYLRRRDKALEYQAAFRQSRGYEKAKLRRNAKMRTPEGRRKKALSMRRFREKKGARVICSLRNRLHQIVKGKKGLFKNGEVEEFVGCSKNWLVRYLEDRWKEGMSWDNYGRKEGQLTWHVDHIVPYAHFREDFESGDRDKIKAASALINHYTNLFPLWGPENAKKGDQLPEWVLITGKSMYSDLHEKAYGIPPDNGEDIETEDPDRQF